jgi:TatD DNase family protein
MLFTMSLNSRYIDIHSHLHFDVYDPDREALLASMRENGVATITVGTDVRESNKAIALAEQNDYLWATVGLHPGHSDVEFNVTDYEPLARHPKVVAIGECGLDYHYIETFFEKDKAEKGLTWNKDAEADRQRAVFEEHIALAVAVDKPLMLHGRSSPKTMDAYEDMCDMIGNAQAKHGDKVRGNFHFFAGNVDIAKRALELGFTVSFPGVITFASQYDDVVRYVPLDRMHGETDAPYAAPIPFRGHRNEPNHVREVYKRIAELRGEDAEYVRLRLLENAKKLFHIEI